MRGLDKSYNSATGLVADVTGGGTLGQVYTQLIPKRMQRRLVDGECEPIYPHQYIRTNTIFEIIKKSEALPPGPISIQPTRSSAVLPAKA